MNRDVVLITGGNSGIGFECARELAREGWHALIASRDRGASAQAVQRIVAESGADSASEMGLDLGSFASVREFAKEIERHDLPLRALVGNAGLQIMTGPQFSADGFERTMAVNHLGHFLLTHLLLRRLIAKSPARIVIVSSGVHDAAQRTGMPKPAMTDVPTLIATGGPRRGEYDGRLAYVNSKLSNMWYVYELVRRLASPHVLQDETQLTVSGFDPGLVPGSGLARDYPAGLRFVWDRVLPGVARILNPVAPQLSTARKSGRALARLVLDPTLSGISGKYFPSHTRWQAAPSSTDSYDLAKARGLWEESVRATGLTPDESPLARV
jgi:NAD(P)-dependent dehydrogenase (short-subunit alcohol dehydrogenase family)